MVKTTMVSDNSRSKVWNAEDVGEMEMEMKME
eukprot:CAMPEP_0198113806 /NCGR_PEP_ID=MMETSP1442-20131203/5384_1 /TAXON_ID= /ORGANISM="Craspedostauros australis, Strain CCMP3328" /LENGTH=31 /DNA_ID= /DNA_START= /DNA_END= /DNA_ORIENTATION=